MIKTLSLVAILALGILAGCGSSETAAETGSTGSASGTDNKNASSSTPASADAGAEMVACAQCKSEYPKAELASHDGVMLCKACIAAHNH